MVNKIIVILLFYLLFINFNSINKVSNNDFFTKIETFYDKNNLFTIEEPPSFNHFKDNNLSFELKDTNIWTLLTIKNISDKKKILYI